MSDTTVPKDDTNHEQSLLDKIARLEDENASLVQRIKSLSIESRTKAQLIHLMLHSTPFGMCIFDSSGVLLRMNKAAEEIFGVPMNLAIGHHCSEFLHCYQDRQCCVVMAGEEPVDRVETRCVTEECEGKLLLRNAVRTEMDHDILILEAFIDISEIKQAETSHQNAIRTKMEFLAKINHELRTPLNIIQGYSQLIKTDIRESDSELLNTGIDAIETSCNDLIHLVEHILDFSEIDREDIQITIQECDILLLINSLMAEARSLAQYRHNTLVVECPDGIGMLNTDPKRLSQILYNLLNNACKFTKNGQITLKIETKDSGKVKGVIFSVIDTGIGIPQDYLEGIFDDFSQGEDIYTRQYGGAGIGLTIARRLVQLLGGNIEVLSEENQGTVFNVWIPSRPM